MKYTKLNQLIPGKDIVAKPIYSKNYNTILIPANVTVTTKMITLLRINNLNAIYILSDEEEQMFFSYEDEIELLKNLRGIHLDKSLDPWSEELNNGLTKLEDILEDAIKKICMEDYSYVHTYMIRSKENWLYYHSISVCILALCTAKNMGSFDLNDLRNIGMAALLHDLGKGKTNEIPDENGKRYDHPKVMYELLRDRGYNIKIAAAIWQHHELEDGSGYPNGITGDKISIYSKIISVCDCYDNISTKKKKIYGIKEAFEFICGNENFDYNIVNSFIRCVRPYPSGSRVKLSNNLEALVIKNYIDSPLRPVISINGTIHDLRNEKEMYSITIEKVI